MAWTYGGDPANSDRDAVRLQIGDTDSTDPQLTDAEVDYFLSQNGTVNAASLAAVRAIMAEYARLVTKSVGDLRVNYSDRLKAYQSLEKQMKAKLITTAKPIAGGISISRKKTVEEDTDRVIPSIERDQFSYPGTEDSSETNTRQQ